MADNVQAFLNAQLNVTLTRDAAASPGASAAFRRRTFSEYNQSFLRMTADMFPVPQAVVDLSKELSGTTFDFDLTAAPRADDINVTVSLSGMRLLAILVNFSDDNNASGMTIGPHPTTNPYSPWGSGIVPVFYPGTTLMQFFRPRETTFTPGTPAVGSGAKSLRIGGTADDVIECYAVFG